MTKEAYHGKTCKKAKLRSEVFDKEIVLKKNKKTTDKEEILVQSTKFRTY